MIYFVWTQGTKRHPTDISFKSMVAHFDADKCPVDIRRTYQMQPGTSMLFGRLMDFPWAHKGLWYDTLWTRTEPCEAFFASLIDIHRWQLRNVNRTLFGRLDNLSQRFLSHGNLFKGRSLKNYRGPIDECRDFSHTF